MLTVQIKLIYEWWPRSAENVQQYCWLRHTWRHIINQYFPTTGDPEAEEILSNIVDYVTRDDNPNDEEQVREILGKARSL